MKSVLNLVGLARRAGKAAVGARLTENSIKSKKAELVIIAEDASDNTKKEISDCARYYNIKYITAFDKELLGHIVGADVTGCVAVEDKNFADGILKKYYPVRKER